MAPDLLRLLANVLAISALASGLRHARASENKRGRAVCSILVDLVEDVRVEVRRDGVSAVAEPFPDAPLLGLEAGDGHLLNTTGERCPTVAGRRWGFLSPTPARGRYRTHASDFPSLPLRIPNP